MRRLLISLGLSGILLLSSCVGRKEAPKPEDFSYMDGTVPWSAAGHASLINRDSLPDVEAIGFATGYFIAVSKKNSNDIKNLRTFVMDDSTQYWADKAAEADRMLYYHLQRQLYEKTHK